MRDWDWERVALLRFLKLTAHLNLMLLPHLKLVPLSTQLVLLGKPIKGAQVTQIRFLQGIQSFLDILLLQVMIGRLN